MEELPVEGEIVAEKYRIECLIGEGSMGRVYRARHLMLGQSVAIKLLRASVDNEELRTRFVREAKATMALRGDHIVRVYDLGVLPSNTPYMVLEYLEGTDLRSVLGTHGALPVEEAVDYVLQVCEALAEAHLNGIVHRDLKPQNLFLTRRANGTPCIKLLDFGVSKFEEHLDGSNELTMSHVMLGSPVFMSPEQIRDSRKVDARADLWSVGVVLYMLLGGGRPFDGEGLGGTCASIMVDPPRPLSARCPSVPPALEAIVFQCLEKARERRTPNVAELARRLEPFASVAGRLSAERVVHLYASSPPRESAALTASPPAMFDVVDVVTETTAMDGTSADATPAVSGEPSGAASGPLSGALPGAFGASGAPSSERTQHMAHAAPSPPRRAAAPALLAASVFVVVAVIGLGGLAWRRVHTARAEAATSSAVASAAAVAAAGASPTEKADAPGTNELPPKNEPPKPEDGAADLGGGHAPAIAPRVATTPAARRPNEGARGARPTSTGSAKRKGQVDRNGVPILD